MIKGFRINGSHYADSLNFIMNYARVFYPEVQTSNVEIFGRNGKLDLTESLGGIFYSNRTIEFLFTIKNRKDAEAFCREIHGQKGNIVLDRDPDYYYVGRCSVRDFVPDGKIFQVKVLADCEPYKYRLRKTVYKQSVDGSVNMILQNEDMSVVPEIISDMECMITFNGSVYNIPIGTCKAYGIKLSKGLNRLKVTGNGTIQFIYREGTL